MTTGLKEAILQFFPWESLARAWQGSDAGQRGREAMPGRNVARQALGKPVLIG